MRAGNIDRVKRRLLKDAVADNVATIQGLPPRALRPARRLVNVWLKRASLVVIPLTVAGSTYVASQDAPAPAAVLQQATSRASAAIPLLYDQPSAPVTERVAASAFPLAVRRVVLDAGHGGSDPGAVADRLTEKDITLDIGRRLQALLEAKGFDVVTTRPDDRTVPLRERAALANQSSSDIFVSIHVNTITAHTESRGVETYYLGATNDPSLTQLAAAENRVSGYSIADMRKLLDGIYADAKSDESRQLANVVQQRLYERLRQSDAGLENWGVKRAPFIVLIATDMPAILAEVGCLSNDREAELLGQPEYRQKIAEALYDGIHAYASANAPATAAAPQKKGTENG